METKLKIIESAISLFNSYGIANVRLTQISDETGISVGNLAYHYKNKEAIVEAVYAKLLEEFSEILRGYMNESSLLDFDRQVSAYYVFFKNNRFYLLNIFEIELNYPTIHAQWQRNTSKMILQFRKRLDYFCDCNYMERETSPGDFDFLAQSIWTTITFWIPQQIIRGKSLRHEIYRRAIWSLITPRFTKKGMDEYDSLIRPLIFQE